MVARQPSVDGQSYSQKSISEIKKGIKPNKENVQICLDTISWITRAVRGSDYSPAIALSEEKDKLV